MHQIKNPSVMVNVLLFLLSILTLVNSNEINFRPCLEFNASSSHLCAKVKVPLDYNKLSGEQIEVFITKVSTSNNPKGVVWGFHGGPSTDDFQNIVTVALPLFKDFEVYAVLQRGAKYGTPLACPETSNGGNKLLFIVINKWMTNVLNLLMKSGETN
jgi:hypothetical protein